MPDKSHLPSERRERIRRILERERYVSVRDLADRVDVSDMTIRRDLEALSAQGRIRRVFGGAQVAESTALEQVYVERISQHREAKERIAAQALAFVRDGDTVALDGSTTSLYLARLLKGRSVVVVTNSLLVAQAVADTDLEVVLPGGVLRGRTLCLVGPIAERNIREFHVDTVFFSSGGLHSELGMTDTNDLEAALKRCLFGIASRAVALIDGSKFGKKALHPLARLDLLDVLVTEAAPTAAVAGALRDAGVCVEVADG